MLKKLSAIIIIVILTVQSVIPVVFADYTDSDTADMQFVYAEETWSLTYDAAADKSANAAVAVTANENFVVGQAKTAAVYKIKLPSLQSGNAISGAQFRMTSYYSPNAREMPYAYKIPDDISDIGELTVADAQKIIDGKNLGKGANFLTNCITDADFSKDTIYRNRYDITDYVIECMQKGQQYMWIAVTRSSTVRAYPHTATAEYWRPKLYYTVKNSNVIDTPITKTRLEGFLESAVNGGHPYLMGRRDDFERIKSEIADGDSLIAQQYERIRQKATAYLGTAVIEIGNPSDSYLSAGYNSAWNIVPYCAFVYLIEGDISYAQRAYEEALYWARLESWGNYQYIDNNQAATAVAICYDWLYDILDESQRAELESALKTKHLDNVKEEYSTGKTTGIARHLRGDHNHAVMNSATIFMQALAIADDDISYSAAIMADALKCINTPVASMYPDSGWREGMGYWHFVGPMIARLMLTMESAFGSCLGYEKLDYMLNIGYFPIHSASTEGNFVVNDMNSVSTDTSFDKYILGRIAGDKRLMAYSLSNDDLSHPFFCLAYDSQLDTDESESEPLENDKLFSESGLVSLRSSHSDEYGLFAAMAVQPADKSHGQMNSGTIGFDALGERWITNTGGDDYSLEGYFNTPDRWDYYAARAEGNSCIVINPSSDGGQNPSSSDTINTFFSSDTHSFAAADLTDTYKGQVTSYKRGIGLFENKRRFVLQDEIVLDAPSDVYSFININQADIKIFEDGTGALISKGDKKLYMSVICDMPYELSLSDSVPLPSSPNPNGQSSFDHISKIVIKAQGASEINIRVTFTPCLVDKETENMKKDVFVPIDDWENITPSLDAELDSIYVNGTKSSAFGGQSRIIRGINYDNIDAVVMPGYGAETKMNPINNLAEIFVYDKSDKTNNYSYVIYPADYYEKYASGVYHISDTACREVNTFSDDVSRGSSGMILFKIPLFKTANGEKTDSAIMDFTAGVYNGMVEAGNIRFAAYGFDEDFEDISSLRFSQLMENDKNVLPSPEVKTDNCGYSDNGAVYHRYSLDVSELAKKCESSGMSYMYVGITAVNSNIKIYGTNRSEYSGCRASVKYAVLSSEESLTVSPCEYICADNNPSQLVTIPAISTSGGVSSKVRTTNFSDQTVDMMLFVAIYSGNKLLECKMTPINALPGTDKEWKTPALSGVFDGETIKSFVWTPGGKPVASSVIEQ